MWVYTRKQATELDVADYIFQKWLQQYFSTHVLF